MSEAVAIENSAVVAPKKKIVRPKSLKPKGKVNHPKVSQMVNTAIVDLKDRGGSSLQAIKKYIAATYKVDVEKLAPFIRKHLKLAVVNGSIIQTKGKGASGSFKVSASGKKIKSKHIVKVKTANQKLVKAKPTTVKSKVLSKSKPKVAMKVKKVTKVKVKKSPARAPKPKKTMKKGSKLIKKTPKLSK